LSIQYVAFPVTRGLLRPLSHPLLQIVGAPRPLQAISFPLRINKMAGDNIDPSKNATTSSTVRPTSSVMTNGTPGHPSHNAQDAIAHNSLELFQWLVGIETPSFLMHSSEPRKRSDLVCLFQPLMHFFRSGKQSNNVGLYQRAKDQERRSRIAYLLTSYISNTLFLLQIMLAAAFTGLSAYKEANAVTLTILGAFNTVVAG
jgi:hypothetical protein